MKKISSVIIFHCLTPLSNCPLKYKGYDYNSHNICLRYEECLKTCKEAVNCEKLIWLKETLK